MKYAYEIKFGQMRYWMLLKRKYPEHIIQECEAERLHRQDVTVQFFKEVPAGYHLCRCGNLATGKEDELCEQCKEEYMCATEQEIIFDN